MLPLLVALSPALADGPGFAYVKVVDRAGFTDSQSTPGADIDAIALVRDGEVVAHAIATHGSQIGEGDHGNAAMDPQQALGPPDHLPRTLGGMVSLGGRGNYVIVELAKPARIGDVLRVHEVGRVSGRQEHTEVCIATAPQGPYMSVGHGYGVFEVVVQPPEELDPKSLCRNQVNS